MKWSISFIVALATNAMLLFSAHATGRTIKQYHKHVDDAEENVNPYASSQSAPKNVKMLLIPLYCRGTTYAGPTEDLHNVFDQLTSTFNYCSSGRSRFSNESVITVPQEIVCADVEECGDYPAWEQYMPELLAQYSDFYIFMIAPDDYGESCDIGLGIINGRQAWIRASAALEPNVYFHELGHSFGLGHATRKNVEYGDLSSAMGYCCTNRCYNAPEVEQLGWSNDNTVQHITSESLSTVAVSKIMSAGPTNFLKIDEDIYVSFRVRSDIESGMNANVSQHVLVHTKNDTDSPTGMKTQLLAVLNIGQEIGISSSNSAETIRIRYDKMSVSNNTATIRLWRGQLVNDVNTQSYSLTPPLPQTSAATMSAIPPPLPPPFILALIIGAFVARSALRAL